MIYAVERMKALGKRSQEGGAPSAVFGTAMSLSQSIESEAQYRIGLYPIVCCEAPELAMGLAACLAYLLEQHNDIRVYQCIAKIDELDGGAEFSSSDYQFTLHDWELAGLADNVQLSGTLVHRAGEYILELNLDTSLLGAAANDSITFRALSLPELVSNLPQIATGIAERVGGPTVEQAIIAYPPTTCSGAQLQHMLFEVFEWNLDVYLQFWGGDWEETDIRQQFSDCAQLAGEVDDEFPRWCLGMMAKQIMQAGLESCGEAIVSQLPQVFPSDKWSISGVSAAARGLAELGHVAPAIELLETHQLDDATASSWISLIDIYAASGQMGEAIEACQRALESGLENPALYWTYAQLLINAESNDWQVEELLFIDPDEVDEEVQISAEIASTMKRRLSHQMGNLSALQLALQYMIDVEDDELWSYFERLIHLDETGDYAGDIIDRLLDLPDHDAAYSILERALDANPYAYVLLTQLALADDDVVLASNTIAACRSRFAEVDDELEIDLQRLELSARLPGFEESFAEIKLNLGDSRTVSEGQVDLLEEAIEIAPKMVDLYVALSRCYATWEDNESAVDVLRDAEQKAGAHPQIDVRMAQILWAGREREAAISRLNSGLAVFPDNVSMLVQMASFLIANDQLEDAREYIVRAETIAPDHRAIWHARRLVAQKMTELS